MGFKFDWGARGGRHFLGASREGGGGGIFSSGPGASHPLTGPAYKGDILYLRVPGGLPSVIEDAM